MHIQITNISADVSFDIPVDLDGDGVMTGVGEGWIARMPFDESLLNPSGETVIVTGDPTLTLGFISLESGEIARPYGDVYLPLVMRSY